MAYGIDPVIEIDAGEADESTAQEVYRNLQILYGTQEGEQALDREFGIAVEVTDSPSPDAQARLAAEYVRKTQKYEPRARVAQVDWTSGNASDGNMIPKVVVELV
jgi:hypothetical protein